MKSRASPGALIRAAAGQQMGPLWRGETQQALINYPRTKNGEVLKVLNPYGLHGKLLMLLFINLAILRGSRVFHRA